MASRVGWTWRVALALTAFGLAFFAFQSGVVVSDRREVGDSGMLTHVYYSLGLFVLGGLDLGVPSEGPEVARAALWLAYFMAPLVTVGVLIESALRLFNPGWIQRQGLRDHIVVVGVGRLGELFLESLYAVRNNPSVLLVDSEESQRLLARARHQFGAPYVCSDIRTSQTLELLALDRARGVALLTGDDLVNLEAAWAVLEAEPRMPVIAHIADLQMKREVDQLMGDTAGHRVRAFNMHHIAAERLYDQHLAVRFQETPDLDAVVLVGFGRFGQTMLEHLRNEAGTQLERVVIIDPAAQHAIAAFTMQTEETTFPVDVIEGDAEDPNVWAQLDSMFKGVAHPPVFIFGTDSDTVNFRLAMLLRKRSKRIEIFVRCFRESRFSAQISSHYGLHVMALEEMMEEALEEQQKKWFN